MDLAKVRALVDLVVESGIAELTVEAEGLKVKVRRQGATAPVTVQAPAAVPEPAPAAPPGADTLTRPVISPIVGTFFRAPSPGAPNFVEVGQRVAVGQTLGIVEAMKVMNEIEAEFAGVVREICVDNAQPVEAEAVLFRIEPD
jgi:acetyl-CoA carboxylase biotin carboxyl carrier protein